MLLQQILDQTNPEAFNHIRHSDPKEVAAAILGLWQAMYVKSDGTLQMEDPVDLENACNPRVLIKGLVRLEVSSDETLYNYDNPF